MDSWVQNDAYLSQHLIEKDPMLLQVVKESRNNGLPEAEVSPTQGKFLYLLAKIKGAKRILEIGTLGGYSTIWLAKALPEDGVLISLEYNAHHATVARGNISNAGFAEQVTILQGAAADTLQALIDAKEAPFDMIFIDADKPSHALYVELSMYLAKSGTVIYTDNIIRNGQLCNADNPDKNVKGVRKLVEALGDNHTLETTALQTVGIKGYDGFTVSVVI